MAPICLFMTSSSLFPGSWLQSVTMPSHAHPKTSFPYLLCQEALAMVAIHTSPTVLHCYTDISVSEGRALGAAFVCKNTTSGHRLLTYSTSFRAELVAILTVLNRPRLHGLLSCAALFSLHLSFKQYRPIILNTTQPPHLVPRRSYCHVPLGHRIT